MEELTKEQFVAFAEGVYMGKLKGKESSATFKGYTVRVTDSWAGGRYDIRVIGPTNLSAKDGAVLPTGLAQSFGSLYEKVRPMGAVEILPVAPPQNVPAASGNAPYAQWGLGGRIGFFENSVGEMLVELEVLRQANRRAETARAFAYDKYREALHAMHEETAEVYAGVLFLMQTGALPSEDRVLYERFATFLAGAVIEMDAEELPPVDGADCG